MNHSPLDDSALRQLFLDARSLHSFSDAPVDGALLQRVYALARMGPTAQNSQPARYAFVTSAQAKARLLPAMMPGNAPKVQAAPVTVILAMDSQFAQTLPTLWPHDPALPSRLAANPVMSEAMLRRNATLGGAYLMLAARALGLACGPMSGFDAAKVDAEFFPDGRWRSNFLCNLGFAAPSGAHARGPRLDFDQACQVL